MVGRKGCFHWPGGAPESRRKRSRRSRTRAFGSQLRSSEAKKKKSVNIWSGLTLVRNMPSHEEAEVAVKGEGAWRDSRFSSKKPSLVNRRESSLLSQSQDSPGMKVRAISKLNRFIVA